MLTVVHRDDQLLQGHKDLDPEQETGMYRLSLMAHHALLKFMDEKLVGKMFASFDAIRAILGRWPEFSADKGWPFDNDVWTGLAVDESRRVLCTVGEGLGGPFYFGRIVSATSTTPVEA